MLIELDFKIHNYNIHVYKRGNGSKNIMLLHGSGIDCAMLSWAEVIQSFSSDYTIYAVDLLGYGKSDIPSNICGENFYSTHIEVVKSIIDTLNLDNLTLIGLSMGGAISIGYTLNYPQKIENLIPVDSWGLSKKIPFHNLIYWIIFKTKLMEKSYSLMAKSRFLVKWSISYSLIGDKSKITDDLINQVLEKCKLSNVIKSFVDYQKSSLTKDGTIPYYIQDLKKISVPVLFINGEKDALVPLKDVKMAMQSLKGSKLYILKGCKHWSPKERPQEFCNVVEKFINEKSI